MLYSYGYIFFSFPSPLFLDFLVGSISVIQAILTAICFSSNKNPIYSANIDNNNCSARPSTNITLSANSISDLVESKNLCT